MKVSIVFLALFALTSCALISKDPKRQQQADIYYTQGTQNMMDENYSDALKNLSHANELRPNDTKTLNNLGMTYYFKGRTEIAIKYLKLALKVDKKNSDARNNLATIYMNNNQMDKAKNEYKTILNDLVYKKTFRVYFNLGIMSLKQRNLASATKYFEKSIGHRDDYCPAHFQLASVYESQSLFSKAMNHYKKASQDNCAKHALPIYHIGKLYMLMGDRLKAREYLDIVVQKFPKEQIARRAAKLKIKLNREKYSKRNNSNKKFIDSENF